MTTVFKYCDENGLLILKNLELKITPPIEFNDPFEFSPRVVSSAPERELRRLIRNKSELKEMHDEEKKKGTYQGSFRDYRRIIKENRSRFMALTPLIVPGLNELVQANFLQAASEVVGVLCLTSRPNSILMWGHYADRHKGILIGFDYSWPTFQDTRRSLKPVKYVCDRPLWDPSQPTLSISDHESMNLIIFSKYKEWDYEAELRQVFSLRTLVRKPIDALTPHAKTGFFLSVPPDRIVSVCFGTRTPKSLESEVLNILSKPEFSHVALQRVRLQDREFALAIEPA